ncbi:MAG: hypothetical protein K2I78_01930, partial [Clostridia bacterium]|nr:hypothetical protein [Clostridia bacterium]
PYIGATSLIKDWQKLAKSKISYTGEKIGEREPKELFADKIDNIVSATDIAVDIYCGMSIASTSYYDYDGSDESFEKLSKNCVFVKSEGLKAGYGDFNIHNIVRDWVLISIVDEVELSDQNGDVAPSGAASDEQIKSMRGKCYYQNSKRLDVDGDSMTLKDRSDGKY